MGMNRGTSWLLLAILVVVVPKDAFLNNLDDASSLNELDRPSKHLLKLYC